MGTHVNLREKSRPIARTRQGTIEEGEVFVRRGEGAVKLVWRDAAHLVIESPDSGIIEQKCFWRNATTSYRQGAGGPTD